ncbi:MAG: hypothetical protein J6X84_07455 [Treponema sp.]|nr:hypothetical protein [Treponema sp.]
MDKTIIKNKKAIIFTGIILIAMLLFFIIKNDLFFYESSDYDISARELVIKNVKEFDTRTAAFYGLIFIIVLVNFVRFIFWKLIYDNKGFSLNDDMNNLIEFEKIISVVHYNAQRYRRGAVDKFIVTYLGYPEFGYEEGLQKEYIEGFPHNSEMKEFFSFMKKANPKIEFSCERATSEGVEISNFDYF